LSIPKIIRRALALVVVLAAAGGSAHAQSFNQFIGFGDSTIDSGFYRALPNPGGGANFNTLWPAAVAAGAGKPTTSPGPMNSEALAAYFGPRPFRPISRAAPTMRPAAPRTST
jgi:outer membrane lipase/esterase